MSELKVCILSAGVGSRMGALSQNVNKAILPINSKAVISHIIEKFDQDTEFVIAVGHKKDTVHDYLELAHPDINITFVEIDKYLGPGSGPGYSLLVCKDHLKCPFVFFTADTIVLEDIPDLENNWFGIAPVKNPEQFCTVKIKDNLVIQIDDKIATNNKFAFIGLAGVKDYEIFFESLQQNKQPISGEIQVSNGFKSLLERKLQPVGFTWFDTGALENFAQTNSHLSGDEERFDFSKGDEFLYFVGNKVIKYFSDQEIVENRVKRSNLLSGLVPNIVNNKANFYSYEKLDGNVLYDILNDTLLGDFLSWCQEKLWIDADLDSEERKEEFTVACKRFYVDKTNQRLAKFFAKTLVVDQESNINGIPTPSVKDLFSKIDWKEITNGVPVSFHGDLQFDNILYQPDGNFKLLDWRQDFAGLLTCGDLYYDLAKLYGGMLLSYKAIKENRFSFEMTNDQVYYNYDINSSLMDAKDAFEQFVEDSGYDLKKIRLITGIIYLNMSPLHQDPFDHLLFFLGKSIIHKSL